MLRKIKWVAVLFFVLALIFIGCPESPKGEKEEGQVPEGWVYTEIFKLSELIKDVPNGEIVIVDDKDANEYLFFDDSFLQAVGSSNTHHKYEVITRNGKKAFKITTVVFWSGLDIRSGKAKFRSGDDIKINFEHNPGPSGESILFWLNTSHIGQEKAGGWEYKEPTNGTAVEDVITLVHEDVEKINSNSGEHPKTLRVRSSRADSEIILYELIISGYRPKDGSDPCTCTDEDCVCDCFGECGPLCPACAPDCDCGCYKNQCKKCDCQSGACCASCLTGCGCMSEGTLGSFLTTNIPALTASLSSQIKEATDVSVGPLGYHSYIGENARPKWIDKNGKLAIRVSGADGNNGLLITYAMNANDKIKITGSVEVTGPGQGSRMLFLNGNTGGWDDLEEKFFFGSHTAGIHEFSITATINAGTAGRGAARLQVGNMDNTVPYFIIDKIEITR